MIGAFCIVVFMLYRVAAAEQRRSEVEGVLSEIDPALVERSLLASPNVTPEIMEEKLDTDRPEPPAIESTSFPPKKNVWVRADGKPDYFRIVMLETKRREAMGKVGKELKWYWDGDHKAIGYGNRITYLSPRWQSVVKKQGMKVSEDQARQMMYETFEELDIRIKRDLPHLNEGQQWAVKSLVFNWGYGNLQNSKLWKYIKKGDKSQSAINQWHKSHARTDNHKRSRSLETSLWLGHDKTAIDFGKRAFESIRERGDFKHYD